MRINENISQAYRYYRQVKDIVNDVYSDDMFNGSSIYNKVYHISDGGWSVEVCVHNRMSFIKNVGSDNDGEYRNGRIDVRYDRLLFDTLMHELEHAIDDREERNSNRGKYFTETEDSVHEILSQLNKIRNKYSEANNVGYIIYFLWSPYEFNAHLNDVESYEDNQSELYDAISSLGYEDDFGMVYNEEDDNRFWSTKVMVRLYEMYKKGKPVDRSGKINGRKVKKFFIDRSVSLYNKFLALSDKRAKSNEKYVSGMLAEANIRSDKYEDELRNILYNVNQRKLIRKGIIKVPFEGTVINIVDYNKYEEMTGTSNANGHYTWRGNEIYLKYIYSKDYIDRMVMTLKHELEHYFDHRDWNFNRQYSIKNVHRAMSTCQLYMKEGDNRYEDVWYLLYLLWETSEVNAFADESISSKKDLDFHFEVIDSRIKGLNDSIFKWQVNPDLSDRFGQDLANMIYHNLYKHHYNTANKKGTTGKMLNWFVKKCKNRRNEVYKQYYNKYSMRLMRNTVSECIHKVLASKLERQK